ncbi:MAG: glycosyltransferase family 9 protein [Hymenobacter sp.]
MLSSLLGRFRQFRRQRRQGRQRAALDQCDAAALANQASPDARRVLVVRNDSIGDYLLYRPWLCQLSAVLHQRGQRLTLAANALWAPLARGWDADLFDELIEVNFGRFATDLEYRTSILQIIGSNGFAEVIYPVHVRQPAVENFIRFLQAPVRVGSQGSHPTGAWAETLDAGYTQLLPTTRAVLFEYYRNQEFFENWLAIQPGRPVAPETPALPWQLPTSVQAAATAEASAGPYLLLFPGASARQKQWPVRHFTQLAQALHARYGSHYRLLLAGSAADDALAQRIVRAAGPGVPLINRCGQTDLPGLAALVAGAGLLISNDTAAAHLAAQAGTPCLVLLMGENYGKFFPYSSQLLQAPCRCLFPPSQEARFAQGDFPPPARDPDLSLITPGRVLAAINELLAAE